MKPPAVHPRSKEGNRGGGKEKDVEKGKEREKERWRGRGRKRGGEGVGGERTTGADAQNRDAPISFHAGQGHLYEA